MRLLFFFGVVATIISCETTRHYPAVECRDYIIAPPPHIDENISNKIAIYWRNKVKSHLAECHEILPYSKHLNAFSTINIDHLSDEAHKNFSPSQGKALLKRTPASHIIFLELIRYKGETYVKPYFYALETGIPTKDAGLDYLMEINQSATEPKQKSQVNSLLVQSISFFPNTFLLGFSQSDIDNSYIPYEAEDRYIRSKEDVSNIPPFLSSISLSNILHSDGFDTFDFTTRFFPSANFGYMRRKFVYSEDFRKEREMLPNREDNQLDYGIDLLFLSATFNYELNFFSPLGATYLTFGYGPGYSYYSDNFDNSRYRFTGFSRLVLGHRFFVSERFLVQFSSETNRSSPRMVDNAVFRSDGYSTFVFQIGYFFPESRSFMRSIF